MDQQLPTKITKYRAFAVDNYSGTYNDLGKIFDSVSAAQDALKSHFEKNPPQTVTEYDIGGYIEEVNLQKVYNPRLGEFYDVEDKP